MPNEELIFFRISHSIASRIVSCTRTLHNSLRCCCRQAESSDGPAATMEFMREHKKSAVEVEWKINKSDTRGEWVDYGFSSLSTTRCLRFVCPPIGVIMKHFRLLHLMTYEAHTYVEHNKKRNKATTRGPFNHIFLRRHMMGSSCIVMSLFNVIVLLAARFFCATVDDDILRLPQLPFA